MKPNKTRLVRKLVSLNPRRYEEWRLDKAGAVYHNYLCIYHRYNHEWNYDGQVKSFERWLTTEI